MSSIFAWRSASLVCVLVSLQGIFATLSHAQYGASPSQTGMFFDDLRARSTSASAASNASTRDGDVAYDFDSGVYRDSETSRMGQRNADLELARDISRPSVRSGSSAYAARSVGDYTNYAGQYTTPTGFFAPTYTSDPFLSGKRNLKVGPANVGFGFFQGVEYNDNVNRSSNATSDIITTTMLSINANYRVTQNNTLSISTAIGFDRYWEHPELSPYGGDSGLVLNVLPGSTIAYDVKVGPVYFTLYNRFSVRPAAQNNFALSQNQTFGVFQNDSGLAANWRINADWTLALNYMHSIANALSSVGADSNGDGGARLTAFNRTTDSLQGSLTYSPNGTWTAGLEGGITNVNYETQFNNDGNLFNMGLFIVLPVGKSTYLRGAAGSQIFSFGDNGVGTDGLLAGKDPLGGTEVFTNLRNARTGDSSDLNDFYYSLTLSNTLNSRVSQALSIGHESALNLTSNYITSDYVNYGVSVVAWRGSKISLSGYFENAQASGDSYFAQDIMQHGFDLYVAHRINSRIQIGGGYHYGYSDPKAVGASTLVQGSGSNNFTQQAFNLDLTYVLSPKATLNFGYRHFVTDVQDSSAADFSQNRLILGYNYNF